MLSGLVGISFPDHPKASANARRPGRSNHGGTMQACCRNSTNEVEVAEFVSSSIHIVASRICSRRPWLHLDANTFHLTQTMELESKPMLRK